jgi:hypothetical protein
LPTICDCLPGVVGVVDLIYISADKKVAGSNDFSPVGEIVDAVSRRMSNRSPPLGM